MIKQDGKDKNAKPKTIKVNTENKENTQRFYYKDNRLKQLKGFITVAKYQSIKNAAEELGLTPGAISNQVSSLEKNWAVIYLQGHQKR